MNTMNFRIILFLSTSIFFAACNTTTNEQNPLDDALTDALIAASDGQGIQQFRLPLSNNFANIPQDLKNPLTSEKVDLGRLLFHETAISINAVNAASNGTFSCSSCHHAQGGFQACLPQGIGEGGIGFGETGEGRSMHNDYTNEDIDVQPIRTPSALNVAFQTSMLWNGQFGALGPNIGTEDAWTADTPKAVNHLGYEGVETQAIAGLGVHRLQVDSSLLNTNPIYTNLFADAFSDFSEEDRITVETAGLAIAAYERTLFPNEAPFQNWLNGEEDAMTDSQKMGAILFFSKGKCNNCHTGPALSSMDFHALGMKDLHQNDYNDAFFVNEEDAAHKGRGGFTGRLSDMYKFKVPQLYNLKDSPFYGHGASFRTIKDVISYKNEATPENPNVPNAKLSSAFHPLYLSDKEIDFIADFIENGLYDPNLERYIPESLPSGNCFPMNDMQSQVDLGCS
ncbi:MAG: cytochrome-c peroxidase [Chitinophagales bacterium]